MRAGLRGLAVLTLLAASPRATDARELFVVCQDDATLVRVDTVRGDVTERLSLPQKPAMIASAQQGRLLFVTHPESGQISRVEVATPPKVRGLAVGGAPFGVVASADGRLLYIGDWNANVVRKLDADTGAVLAEVADGRGPTGLAMDLEERRLFAANRESRSITVVVDWQFNMGLRAFLAISVISCGTSWGSVSIERT